MVVRYWEAMSVMRWPVRHLSVALLGATGLAGLAAGLAGLAAASRPEPVHARVQSSSSTFVVMFQGVRIGAETVAVTRNDSGWVISSTGQIAQPLDLTTTKFEATYAPDWQPLKLAIEGAHRGQLITLLTVFQPTSATSDFLQSGQRLSVTHTVSPGTVALPNNFFAAYEALAARLGPAAPGTKVPVYVAPQAEIVVTVEATRPRRVVTVDGAIEFKQFDLSFANPSGPLKAEMWIDGRNRFARLVLPAASLTVIRDDLSVVMAREERISRPGDEDVFIPANGFNLGGTVSEPAAAAAGAAKGAAGRFPAVVLVAGSGRQDRDELVFGIPILGQLAGSLADAGFVVVRYDKRGVGLSGGRVESATLDDYATDIISVVNWLRRRKDVDPDRIAVVGHSEGGAVAMLAADREKRIKAIGLVATPGRTGRETTLEQQQRLLARSKDSAEDRKAKVELQERIMDAATSGRGWEAVPPALRREADTAWFRSWLQFDPAAAMKKIDQPVLIVQGALDAQVPPAHADHLETFSRARRTSAAAVTRKIVVPGVNHLLVPARTGEVDEYPTLAVKTVAPEISQGIAEWLKSVLR
jgi:pimeloyl-ACP methyl ester carboxylesterase